MDFSGLKNDKGIDLKIIYFNHTIIFKPTAGKPWLQFTLKVNNDLISRPIQAKQAIDMVNAVGLKIVGIDAALSSILTKKTWYEPIDIDHTIIGPHPRQT